jgi:predicted ABC-type ATPase
LGLNIKRNLALPVCKIVIIAGPNGAGKTTFAREFLPNEAGCPVFINADLIAAGLAPFQPEAAAIRAGRIMLGEIRDRVAKRQSFSFETTLSGKYYARQIPGWRAAGFHVSLHFLELSSPEIALSRVAARVAQGGHDIPEATIRRRFATGLQNFHGRYKSLVDGWMHYDNSGNQPVLIDWGDV